jgi:hypothetical protein
MKRPTASTSTLANKTAVLEEKLDGIVQMLQRSQVPQAMVPSPPQEEVQNEDHTVSSLQAAHETISYHPAHPPPTPATSTTSGAMNHVLHYADRGYKDTTSPSATCDYPLENEDELEECLDNYRNKMVPFFPVVCIEPKVTAKDLREERPCKLAKQVPIMCKFCSSL